MDRINKTNFRSPTILAQIILLSISNNSFIPLQMKSLPLSHLIKLELGSVKGQIKKKNVGIIS